MMGELIIKNLHYNHSIFLYKFVDIHENQKKILII